MRVLVRHLIYASIFAVLLSQAAPSQRTVSIEQLREQIAKLTAINIDPATPLEIKNINRGFLEERRQQLLGLLRRKLDALHTYQATVENVLSASEKEVLAKSISDVETEIKELGAPITPETSPLAGRTPVKAGLPSSQPGGNNNGNSPPRVASSSRSSLASSSLPASAQGANDFNNWLSNRIDERIKATAQAKIDQRSNVNQTEAPTIGDNSTSLVDQSSASDLIGLALNLSGLTGGNNDSKDKNSAAITASAYSLYSTLNGAEPLDPSFYNRHRNWRRLSFTLGFEKGQTDNQGKKIEDTTIAGAKYLFVSRRDAGHPSHKKEFDVVYENLKSAAVNLAQLNKEIKDFLFFRDPTMRNKLRIVEEVRFYIQEQIRLSTDKQEKEDFQKLLDSPVDTWFDTDEKNVDLLNVRLKVENHIERKYLGPDNFESFRKALDDDVLKEIDQFIDARLEAFTNLNNASRRAIEKIRRAPQLSLSFMSKLKKEDADEYTGEAIFDYGVHDRVNLTLNGGYFYKNSRIIGGDLRGARFAGQLQFQATPEKSLIGRSPLYFYLASEGNWASGTDFIYRLQGKVKIPVAEGIDLPLSLTFANRTNLIKERDVRGQFGFTFDSAKLFRAFLSK